MKNEGSRAARELAQLYVHDVVASVTQPVRELKAYQHVELDPGQAKQVSFTIASSDLQLLGRDLKPVTEAGRFQVWIAPSAEADGLVAEFEVKD